MLKNSHPVDEVEQVGLGRRLLKHPDAKLSGPSDNGRRKRSGDQENWDTGAISPQSLSQFQTSHLRHVMVQDQARQMLLSAFRNSAAEANVSTGCPIISSKNHNDSL